MAAISSTTSIQSLAPSMETSLTHASVRAICGKSRQVMVYGFGHCQYQDVTEILKSKNFGMRAFDWALAEGHPRDARTREGRSIPLFTVDRITPGSTPCARACKASLTGLAVENYKRHKEGRELVPIIFCLDIDSSPFPLDIDNIVTNHPDKQVENGRITHKELRRYAKLCCDPLVGMDPAEAEIFRRSARTAIKCVRLVRDEGNTYRLDLIPAPWELSAWQVTWDRRKSRSVPKEKPDDANWRKQLISETTRYQPIYRLQVAGATRIFAALERVVTFCKQSFLSAPQASTSSTTFGS